MKQLCKITYISNAGVFLEIHDKKILIDSLCKSNLPVYKNPTDKIKEEIVLGIPPFNNIDLMLFTHHHADHFDAESTAEFLKHNVRAVIIATAETILQINNELSHLESIKLIKSHPALYSMEEIQMNGIYIQSISMLHDGKKYEDIQNLAYLIDIYGKRILHVGDAKPLEENYIDLDLVRKNIDLLIVPFPYISITAGRQIIEKYIKPKKVAAVHLPHKEFDSDGWIDAAKKSYMKIQHNFAETVFLEKIEDSIII